MSDYQWQDGDYILTNGLTEKQYCEAAAAWLAAGVRNGQFPDVEEMEDFRAFGVADGEMYHGETRGTFADGRRVELVNGSLQVADEDLKSAPKNAPMAFTGITTEAGARRLIDTLIGMGYEWRIGVETGDELPALMQGGTVLYARSGLLAIGAAADFESTYDASWLNDNEPRATMPDGNEYTAFELREALRQVEG